MMQKIFIAYGTGGYLKSLHRIGKEAKKLGIFSKVILYTEKDMPLFIQASPLKVYGRGNGYWVWKPYIIWKTMQEYPNSIVVYADSGCTLQPNMEEWNKWFELLETYDTLAFRYRLDYVYPWQEDDETIMTTDAQWTKESLIRYFDLMIGNRDWINTGQIWSGLVLACRNSKLVKMWMDITLMHPELIIDCYGNETVEQAVNFREHRHDQSVFSALCEYWSIKGTVVKVLTETAESSNDAAVLATRKRILKNPVPLKTRMILSIKGKIGTTRYESMHKKLSKTKLFKKWVLHIEHKGAISKR
jgi:hypothetical protein